MQLPNLGLGSITRFCPLRTPLLLEPQVWKPLLEVPRGTTVYLVLSGLDALTSDETSWDLLAEKLQGFKGENYAGRESEDLTENETFMKGRRLVGWRMRSSLNNI